MIAIRSRMLATSSELALEGELVGRRRNGRALGLEL